MSYLMKGGTVCNPAKKNLTVFQNSFQETYTYQSGTTPVYGDPPIIRYDEKWVDAGAASASFRRTNINALDLTVSGSPGQLVTGTIVWTDTYSKPYQGSVTDRNTTPVNTTIGSDGYSSVASTQGQSGHSYAIVSNTCRKYNKQRTPVYGERPIIRYDPVYAQGTRTAWNTKWRKLSA